MIAWLPWSREAFARAARERKPVLLSITAAWCDACHEMDRTTYADPSVGSLVDELFVPVRVDTDRRPDINERYNLGGWPTTAFLTADGDVISGSTFVAVDRMPEVLRRVADAYGDLLTGERENRRNKSSSPELLSSCEDLLTSSEKTIESIFSTFDDEYGGFGIEPKFPHTAPLHLAMALWRETEDGRWRSIVERTLDAMAGGGLHDGRCGGYFRYATTRDWQLPHHEKLLETNAEILRACAEAARTFERAIDRDRTAAAARFITTRLCAVSGGWYGSDADRVMYLDGNAAAARALLAASVALDDPALGRDALASFERVLLACYRPGAGVAHCSDGEPAVRGLLLDHVASIETLVDAYVLTGTEPYRMLAEELAHSISAGLWDEDRGGFFDRAPASDDVGLLRLRRKPFTENARAAAALFRLADCGGDVQFAVRAEGALQAAAAQLDGQGPEAAHYVLAARLPR